MLANQQLKKAAIFLGLATLLVLSLFITACDDKPKSEQVLLRIGDSETKSTPVAQPEPPAEPVKEEPPAPPTIWKIEGFSGGSRLGTVYTKDDWHLDTRCFSDMNNDKTICFLDAAIVATEQ